VAALRQEPQKEKEIHHLKQTKVRTAYHSTAPVVSNSCPAMADVYASEKASSNVGALNIEYEDAVNIV
jgi:hypothetical protein